ncbi:hypothetical protein A2767_05300 [Candidatus Roizmanbacteria bacterium RIFCSPHIGHO2_01_FULL_35_10]|uniref:Uncharacterized protein n=1 Tax=Candidatus Roizmanbacteria bacterium RIFCSPLOWO2_01_FULL_35_13 TaxID=1802055 RepID=A0A1F7IBW9_9BACT|nr:MAG: hypothetical protein A2767_05300 [Candidatus Roizmanbacteria bacterium RIFCSPHIGHO2_01_FULL_35_10]OGK40866.1 MAG: hypothetical protein A3A74_05985 [Candidatus Roizmanbacteria bacterium RIFCSPLOWO2_01_FULL_35_13]
MNTNRLKKFLSLVLTALSIFALIFIIYSIVVISRIAHDKRKKQEIKIDYADEYVSPLHR